MKITEDVRKYAEEQGIADDQALKTGMEQKLGNLRKRGQKFTRRLNRLSR